MNDYALKLANYWRNSLADAENGNGALSARQVEALTPVGMEHAQKGCLPAELVTKLFAAEPAEAATIKVTLRPWVYLSQREHGKVRAGIPAAVTPLICTVWVSRDGRLYPTTQAFVPRDILEPLDKDTFFIGAQSALDDFLSTEEVPAFSPPGEGEVLDVQQYLEQWRRFYAFCLRMAREVGTGWDAAEDGMKPAKYSLLFKEDQPDGFSKNIVNLYDHLRQHKPDAPLFERFAQRDPSPDEPCLPPGSLFGARLGHASDEYALAPAQRDALAHLMAGKVGDVLAVNGPPGTGKTTLVLSVVASLWAKAAVAGREPPVIVASSTNNQAVTNIIAAFGKDFAEGTGPLAGRWLPGIKSFGAYFPRASAEAELSSVYQTKSFFQALESSTYLDKAERAYLAKAAAAFPGVHDLDVKRAVELLQQQIRARQQQLAHIEQAWPALTQAREALRVALGENPQATLQARQTDQVDQLRQLNIAQQRFKGFKHYLAHESMVYSFFSWIRPIAAKRLRLAKLQLDGADVELQNAATVGEIETRLESAEAEAGKEHQRLTCLLQTAEQLIEAEQHRLHDWEGAIRPIADTFGKPADQVTLEDCDGWADTSLRFEMFLLTTHYWEGRWLLEVSQELQEIVDSRKKTGAKTLVKNWRRWMKLTPCVVSTFFRLPKELSCKRYDDGDYIDDYLVDFIDLLIVDEAGQVVPEVAAPSFALARQALVIGDTQQIEPIWSIPAKVDIGNLTRAGLVSHSQAEEDYEVFCEGGRSAASGSVMAIAQSTSRYHYDPDLARGMYLYEHRRCYDAIIAFCNALCYKGKLLPRRGQATEQGLPGLGYLHIDGLCEQDSHGSRRNLLEAQTIAAWIHGHADALQRRYENKALHEIVGVITPFGAQSRAIVEACQALGINAGKGADQITVGTVHSFQGAERPVVIFSTVYSKHADGGFIDRRDSMLNVAVSRAKDSFLVFGDMDLIDQEPVSKPRGLLAKYLLADPASELQFEYQPRQDLHTASTGLSHLHDWWQHDQFLKETLKTANHQVQIITPWVKLDCLFRTGALEQMRATVDRGVKVEVFTDLQLNTEISYRNPQGEPQKIAAFNATLAELEKQGIPVRIVNKVHSKIVMADQSLLCVGSFNWLSAQREGDYVRHETSMVYRGVDVNDEIELNRESLAGRATSYSG
ncbi:AAA domain-containing protein [Pseudomonas sp. NPDC089395]|uniref:AAA domain-containing protein n=1 Tax=Pseudomonas sp. NPDC089395 TaxID=3364460 RepID=UPI003815F334